MGKRKFLTIPIVFMLLMMIMMIFSQLAMEIYAYNFVAGKNIERTNILTLKNYMDYRKITDEAATETEAEKQQEVTAAAPVISLIKPVQGGITTSVYGDTVSRNSRHQGHDWAVETGTEVVASADGYVEMAYYSDSYGYNILVNHGNGMETRYAHLSQLKVSAGQQVRQNQVIGLSGSTGDSTGPHLHFEVIKDGNKVNPLYYIK